MHEGYLLLANRPMNLRVSMALTRAWEPEARSHTGKYNGIGVYYGDHLIADAGLDQWDQALAYARHHAQANVEPELREGDAYMAGYFDGYWVADAEELEDWYKEYQEARGHGHA